MSSTNVFNICRLCLSSTRTLLDVFNKCERIGSTVIGMVRDLLRYKVFEVKGQPWMICKSCVSRLHEACDFVAQCMRSNMVFDGMLQLRMDGTSTLLSYTKHERRGELQIQSKEVGVNSLQVRSPTDFLEDGGTPGSNQILLPGASASSAKDSIWNVPQEGAGDDGVDSVVEFCWCSECGEEFLSLRELKVHSKWCRAKERQSVLRETKEKECVDDDNFILSSKNISWRPFDPNVCCGRCRKVFRTKESLILHIEKYDFKCKEKGTPHSKSLDEKTAGIEDKSESPSFSGKEETNHQEGNVSFRGNNHEGNSGICCPQCGKTLKTRKKLEHHIKQHDMEDKEEINPSSNEKVGHGDMKKFKRAIGSSNGEPEKKSRIKVSHDSESVVPLIFLEDDGVGKDNPVNGDSIRSSDGSASRRSLKVSVDDGLHSAAKDYFCCSKCGEEFQRLQEMKAHSEFCSGKRKWRSDSEDGVSVPKKKNRVNEQRNTDSPSSEKDGQKNIRMKQKLEPCENLGFSDAVVESNLNCPNCGRFFANEKIFAQHINACGTGIKVKNPQMIRDSGNETMEDNIRMSTQIQKNEIIDEVDDLIILDEKKSNVENINSKDVFSHAPSVSVDDNNPSVVMNMLYTCDYCHKTSTTKPELRDHMVKCHLAMNPQKCPVCHRLFVYSEELEEHSLIHPKDKKYFCTVCEESSQSLKALKAHIKERHDVRLAYVCSICFNGFGSRAELGFHHTTMHPMTGKPFCCSSCGKYFINKLSYTCHLKVCQLKTVSFRCEVCGKELSSKGNLVSHSFLHSQMRKYSCRMCNKVFSGCRARNIHETAYHLKIRPHKCILCTKCFATNSDLKAHYFSHSNEKSFCCPECSNLFRYKRNLRRHLREQHLK